MSFRQSHQFRRYHPSTQSANPSATSVSSVTSDNPSISFSQFDNPSDTSATSNNPSVSFVPSDNPSVSFATSYDPPVSSTPLSSNPATLVNRNTIEPTHHAPGTASLYLPVECLLTLPGHRAFTQYLRVPSEQQAQIDLTPAHGPSANPCPHPEDIPYYPSEAFSEGDLLTDGLQISEDPFSSPSRNSHKKIRQWKQWSDEVIPSLIQPYLRYQRLSRKLCDPVTPQLLICKNNCVCHQLKVV